MAGIVAFPHGVHEALRHFGDRLPNEPQRRHVAEYLTGLSGAADKNVSASNREFARPRHQSCLNRFLTDAAGDTEEINQRRLQVLPEDPSTRSGSHGRVKQSRVGDRPSLSGSPNHSILLQAGDFDTEFRD